MIIEVKVKTSSKKRDIILMDNIYIVSLKSKPHDNMANFELVDLISKYFNTTKSSVKILRGLKSKKKIVEILDE